MKRIAFLFLCFFHFVVLPAQGIPPEHSGKPVTRAVVVGISDYQDPAIPDLQFADRDAKAFAEWLRSPAGGSVPEQNLQLLLNEKATGAAVIYALYDLVKDSGEGDLAIIYFSGHGDVESITYSTPGFLLCWDSPPMMYYSGGSLQLGMLQEMVATLSLTKKAQVLLISDACHAGKLAGSEVGGPQVTAGNLAKLYAKEIRILSCQPGEFSLESTQWGGGRGCFSWHLTNGLYGLADRNEDGIVNLLEIENYLEDRVPEETAPHPQLPFVVGDKTMRVSTVDADLLARIRASGTAADLAKTESKGTEAWVMSRADSSVLELYAAFNAALERGDLLTPAGTSANDYYERLIQEPALESLHGLMTRNLAVALIDESQQVTNKLLKTDPFVVSDLWSRPFVFDHIPGYIARAIELLGEGHYLYNQMKAKQLFFEGKVLRLENASEITPDSIIKIALGKMEAALTYDSNAAYVYADLVLTYLFKTWQLDKALTCAKKAVEISPSWVYAHYLAGSYYLRVEYDTNKADLHLFRAIELDSTFLPTYQELMFYGRERGVYYREMYIRKVKTLLDVDPQKVPVYYRMLLGGALISAGRLDEAKVVLTEAEKMSNGQDAGVLNWLCTLYFALDQYEQAAETARKAVELGPFNPNSMMFLVNSYWSLNQPSELIKILETVYSDINDPFLLAAIGETYLQLGRAVEATQLFLRILAQLPEARSPYEMNMIGRAHLGLGNLEAMQRTIEEGQKKFSHDPLFFYQAACLYALDKQEQKALAWLEVALNKGINISVTFADPDWNYLRNTAGFKALRKKYFPEQGKD